MDKCRKTQLFEKINKNKTNSTNFSKNPLWEKQFDKFCAAFKTA